MIFRFVRTYKRLLHERPFITNVLTTCTFMSSGDLISQLYQKKERVDFEQTARFALAGLIFVGPAVRGCLVMIDRIFGPTTSIAVVGKKLTLDQLICAPIFLAGNITTLTLLKIQSLEQVRKELDENYFSLLKLNYGFWPFVQLMNFWFIPLTYRVIFGSSASLIWNTIFSYSLYRKENLEQD